VPTKHLRNRGIRRVGRNPERVLSRLPGLGRTPEPGDLEGSGGEC